MTIACKLCKSSILKTSHANVFLQISQNPSASSVEDGMFDEEAWLTGAPRGNDKGEEVKMLLLFPY